MNDRNRKLYCIIAAVAIVLWVAYSLWSNYENNPSDIEDNIGIGWDSKSTDMQRNSTDKNFINGLDDTYYLPVISTTDIHGYMVDISSGDESSYQYRLSYIANEINKIRKQNDVVLVDTGDCYQGSVLSGKLDGQPILAYLDMMNYDAVCLGNHEFDWGLDATIDPDGTIAAYDLSETDRNKDTGDNAIKGEGDVPVLCWNLYDRATGEKSDFTQDYVIVNKTAKSSDGQEKPLKVAILGYINDYSSSISKNLIADYEIRESDISAVEEAARNLEASGEADVSILVSHVSPDELDELVEENSAIDLVVCGHSHKTDAGELSNGVDYILGGCNGKSYASAILAVTEDNQIEFCDKQVKSVTKDVRNLYDNEDNDGNLDDAVMEISRVTIDMVNKEYPEVMEKLGYITIDISDDDLDGSIGENVATNWAASMVANVVDADVGVINSTGVRSEILLSKGEKSHYVTGADIYNMFPFDGAIRLYSLTYEQLIELCASTTLNSHSYLGISGVTAYFENGDDKSVSVLYLGNDKIYDNGWVADKNTTVKVAVPSFVAKFNNLCFKELKPLNNYGNTIDNVLIIEYLRDNYGPDKEIEVDTEVHLHNKSK